MTISDYVASVLAAAHGVPEYAPYGAPALQKELPLMSA